MPTAQQLLDIQTALDDLRDFIAAGVNHQAEIQKKSLLDNLEPLGYTLQEDPKKYFIVVKK